jgi:hypothetical protein
MIHRTIHLNTPKLFENGVIDTIVDVLNWLNFAGYALFFLVSIAALIFYHVRRKIKLKGSFSTVDSLLNSNNPLFIALIVLNGSHVVRVCVHLLVAYFLDTEKKELLVLESIQYFVMPSLLISQIVLLYKWNAALYSRTNYFILAIYILIGAASALVGLVCTIISGVYALQYDGSFDSLLRLLNVQSTLNYAVNSFFYIVSAVLIIIFIGLIIIIYRKTNNTHRLAGRYFDFRKFLYGSCIILIAMIAVYLWIIPTIILYTSNNPSNIANCLFSFQIAITTGLVSLVKIILFSVSEKIPGTSREIDIVAEDDYNEAVPIASANHDQSNPNN